MDYNYSKLKGKIRERYNTQEAFASALGIGTSTLNLKLNNRAEWTQAEMSNALRLLGESLEHVDSYFFTHCV